MTKSAASFLRFPGRDRLIILVVLVALVAVAWSYTFYLAGSMEMMPSWSFSTFVAMAVMWIVMMTGMMLPSASPMILLHARVFGQNAARPQVLQASAAFVAGYLVVWTLFSLGATILQYGASEIGLLTSMMATADHYVGAALLAMAGVYQVSPWKDRCLSHCRGPIQFLTRHWRKRASGAFRMGLHHGAYCVGCCWALMLLLFFFGVMNLVWIAVLAVFVLLEKIVPGGRRVSQASGIALMVAAIGFVVTG